MAPGWRGTCQYVVYSPAAFLSTLSLPWAEGGGVRVGCEAERILPSFRSRPAGMRGLPPPTGLTYLSKLTIAASREGLRPRQLVCPSESLWEEDTVSPI